MLAAANTAVAFHFFGSKLSEGGKKKRSFLFYLASNGICNRNGHLSLYVCVHICA